MIECPDCDLVFHESRKVCQCGWAVPPPSKLDFNIFEKKETAEERNARFERQKVMMNSLKKKLSMPTQIEKDYKEKRKKRDEQLAILREKRKGTIYDVMPEALEIQQRERFLQSGYNMPTPEEIENELQIRHK